LETNSLDPLLTCSDDPFMNPIEKAARNLCRASGENEDDFSKGTPRWTAYLPQVMMVIDALHEPNRAMTEAGSEIIRHVGHEESDTGYQSDAANVWRFMMDALHQDDWHIPAQTTAR
jgi:hypothetical protein